ALEAGLGGEQRGDAARLGRGRGVGADVARGWHERSDAVVRRLPGRAFDLAEDLLVLGVGILEVRGGALQERDDRRSERRGEQECDAGDDQDASSAVVGERCEAVDHRGFLRSFGLSETRPAYYE